MAFFASTGGRQRLNRVVLVRFGEARLIGFLTHDAPFLPGVADAATLVAVYMPFSYALGGYTVLMPRDRVEACDLSVEEAMRFALTAGLAAKPVEPVVPVSAG